MIPNLVSNEDNDLLSKLPSMEEIKNAVFSMNGNGAPGPNGFGGFFYQHFWDIIAKDVYNAVLQFFKNSWVLPNLNSSVVVLIPKIRGANRVEQFRPICLSQL